MPSSENSATAQTASFIHRRRFPRRRMRKTVGILVSGKYSMAMGIEVGEGGLLFQTKLAIPVGGHIVVNFFIPGRGFVAVQAQILYARDQGATKGIAHGVKFHELAFERRRMIRDYIADKTANEEN